MQYEPVFFDIETTGLNPLQQSWWSSAENDAAIIAIAIGTVEGWREGADNADLDIDVLDIDSTNARLFGEERNLLKELSSHMEELLMKIEGFRNEGNRETEAFLVGYNSRNFDHMWLASRYSRQRLDPWPWCHRRKRLDIMKSVQNLTGRFWSQDDWAENLGLDSNDDITGKDVPEMYNKGRMDKVRKHAYWDLKDLMRMFLADRDHHMQYFYDHYDMELTANFRSEVEI